MQTYEHFGQEIGSFKLPQVGKKRNENNFLPIKDDDDDGEGDDDAYRDDTARNKSKTELLQDLTPTGVHSGYSISSIAAVGHNLVSNSSSVSLDDTETFKVALEKQIFEVSKKHNDNLNFLLETQKYHANKLESIVVELRAQNKNVDDVAMERSNLYHEIDMFNKRNAVEISKLNAERSELKHSLVRLLSSKYFSKPAATRSSSPAGFTTIDESIDDAEQKIIQQHPLSPPRNKMIDGEKISNLETSIISILSKLSSLNIKYSNSSHIDEDSTDNSGNYQNQWKARCQCVETACSVAIQSIEEPSDNFYMSQAINQVQTLKMEMNHLEKLIKRRYIYPWRLLQKVRSIIVSIESFVMARLNNEFVQDLRCISTVNLIEKTLFMQNYIFNVTNKLHQIESYQARVELKCSKLLKNNKRIIAEKRRQLRDVHFNDQIHILEKNISDLKLEYDVISNILHTQWKQLDEYRNIILDNWSETENCLQQCTRELMYRGNSKLFDYLELLNSKVLKQQSILLHENIDNFHEFDAESQQDLLYEYIYSTNDEEFEEIIATLSSDIKTLINDLDASLLSNHDHNSSSHNLGISVEINKVAVTSGNSSPVELDADDDENEVENENDHHHMQNMHRFTPLLRRVSDTSYYINKKLDETGSTDGAASNKSRRKTVSFVDAQPKFPFHILIQMMVKLKVLHYHLCREMSLISKHVHLAKSYRQAYVELEEDAANPESQLNLQDEKIQLEISQRASDITILNLLNGLQHEITIAVNVTKHIGVQGPFPAVIAALSKIGTFRSTNNTKAIFDNISDYETTVLNNINSVLDLLTRFRNICDNQYDGNNKLQEEESILFDDEKLDELVTIELTSQMNYIFTEIDNQLAQCDDHCIQKHDVIVAKQKQINELSKHLKHAKRNKEQVAIELTCSIIELEKDIEYEKQKLLSQRQGLERLAGQVKSSIHWRIQEETQLDASRDSDESEETEDHAMHYDFINRSNLTSTTRRLRKSVFLPKSPVTKATVRPHVSLRLNDLRKRALSLARINHEDIQAARKAEEELQTFTNEVEFKERSEAQRLEELRLQRKERRRQLQQDELFLKNYQSWKTFDEELVRIADAPLRPEIVSRAALIKSNILNRAKRELATKEAEETSQARFMISGGLRDYDKPWRAKFADKKPSINSVNRRGTLVALAADARIADVPGMERFMRRMIQAHEIRMRELEERNCIHPVNQEFDALDCCRLLNAGIQYSGHYEPKHSTDKDKGTWNASVAYERNFRISKKRQAAPIPEGTYDSSMDIYKSKVEKRLDRSDRSSQAVTLEQLNSIKQDRRKRRNSYFGTYSSVDGAVLNKSLSLSARSKMKITKENRSKQSNKHIQQTTATMFLNRKLIQQALENEISANNNKVLFT